MSTNTNTNTPNTPVANVNLPPCLRGLTSKDLRFKPLKVSQKTKKDGTQSERKYGAYFFQIRTGGKWGEVASLPIAAALLLKEYHGIFNADTAAISLARLMHLLGIEAPAAVIEAADEAEARIEARAAKKAAHEAEVVAAGKDAYKTAAADRADIAWAKLVDRVKEREQEQGEEQGEEE